MRGFIKETGEPFIGYGWGPGCSRRHYDAALALVADISPYSRWMERTAHHARAEAAERHRFVSGDSRAYTLRHMSDEAFAEYLEYAADTERFPAAIPEILDRAALIPCETARAVASFRFDWRDREVWFAQNKNGTIAGKTWRQIQQDEKWLQPVADYICGYYRHFKRIVQWAPGEAFTAELIDTAPSHYFQPVITIHPKPDYTETDFVWTGQKYYGLTGSPGWAAHNGIFLSDIAHAILRQAKTDGRWPDGTPYDSNPRRRYVPHVISVYKGECYTPNIYGCIAFREVQPLY